MFLAYRIWLKILHFPGQKMKFSHQNRFEGIEAIASDISQNKYV